VQVWSVSPAKRVASVSGHIGMVYGVAVANDASRFASGGVDGTLRLWSLGTGGESTILARYQSAVNNITISGDGRLLAAAVLGYAFDLWSVDRRELVASFPMGPRGTSWAIALS